MMLDIRILVCKLKNPHCKGDIDLLDHQVDIILYLMEANSAWEVVGHT